MTCDHDEAKGCCKLLSVCLMSDNFHLFANSHSASDLKRFACSIFSDPSDLFPLYFFLLAAIATYPTITLSEYGTVRGDTNIMNEIFTRGPVSAYIDATCIETYTGGE